MNVNLEKKKQYGIKQPGKQRVLRAINQLRQYSRNNTTSKLDGQTLQEEDNGRETKNECLSILVLTDTRDSSGSRRSVR